VHHQDLKVCHPMHLESTFRKILLSYNPEMSMGRGTQILVPVLSLFSTSQLVHPVVYSAEILLSFKTERLRESHEAPKICGCSIGFIIYSECI
jgi:hypothetical protein